MPVVLLISADSCYRNFYPTLARFLIYGIPILEMQLLIAVLVHLPKIGPMCFRSSSNMFVLCTKHLRDFPPMFLLNSLSPQLVIEKDGLGQNSTGRQFNRLV